MNIPIYRYTDKTCETLTGLFMSVAQETMRILDGETAI